MKHSGLTLGCTALALILSLSAPALAQDIDFGDDSSRWANNDKCDDPRFEGPGAANFRSPVDEMRDATDCQAAFDAGDVALVTQGDAAADETGDTGSADATESGDIDFGDDSGAWANDGECDDPRFGGALASHELADATDCLAAYEAGEVTFVGGDDPSPTENGAVAIDDIDFGDDSGSFANDGECDDPRFGGSLTSHELADAADCRAAYEAGEVTYSGSVAATSDTTVSIDDIDFGDDSGTWANDGECDDPRFGGALASHELADATDCRTAYEAGDVTFVGDAGQGTSASGEIDFGDDSGTYANDGECDDARFTGAGMGAALDSHIMADATDCRTAYEDGTISLADDNGGSAPSSSIVVDGIDFGDDSGNWAHDGECDDPRFSGSGAGVALDDHLMADATDCSTAYQAGTVTLSEDGGNGASTDFRINFGDNSSTTANDGVCDDPRFQGRGGAMELLESNILSDAADCRAAYEAGTVTYNP